VAQVAALGSAVATAPWRILNDLTAPSRAGLARNVRRSIGITEEPVPPSMDPEAAFLHPESVARLVHSDLPTMLVGGISALLLQTLHPLAMAGVAEHSNYQEDPLGRLRRTATFVGTTTFGTGEEVNRAVAQVRRVHRRVKGIAPDGRPYSAADPDLVTFIHAAEMSSFLESAKRYGPRVLTPEQCDRYFDEVAPVALALGARWVPRSAQAMDHYFGRLRPELGAGAQARQARDWLRRGVGEKPEDRAVYALLLAAAIGILPRWARRELALAAPAPLELLRDTVAVVPLTRALSAALRWVVAAQAVGEVVSPPAAQVAMESPPSMPQI
jgi:uncharacterized protein (DUF2236 family)